jgi:hypothetical protein
MFKLNKTFISLIAPLAIGLVAISGTAHAASEIRFVHEKSGYSVKGWSKPDGSITLRGVHADGSRFDIQVTAKGRITGTIKGETVDYMLDEKAREDLAMN